MSTKRSTILKKLVSPRFLIIIATIIISIFYAFVPSIQVWVANNMTLFQNWEEETKMPSAVLVVFGILVIGSFVYLIYDALKENDTERIKRWLQPNANRTPAKVSSHLVDGIIASVAKQSVMC